MAKIGAIRLPRATIKRAKARIVHCADMLEQAMLVEATVQERRLLWLAAVGRLVSPRTASGYLPVSDLTSVERASLLDEFLEHVQTARTTDVPRLLEANWKDVQQWTRGFYWLPSEGDSRESSWWRRWFGLAGILGWRGPGKRAYR